MHPSRCILNGRFVDLPFRQLQPAWFFCGCGSFGAFCSLGGAAELQNGSNRISGYSVEALYILFLVLHYSITIYYCTIYYTVFYIKFLKSGTETSAGLQAIGA